MENQHWKYKPSRQIRNFKDLELERQKLAIYQEFLGELIGRDQDLIKKAMRPQNLIAELFTYVTANVGKDSSESGIFGSNFIAVAIKWIMKVFLGNKSST